MYHVQNWSKAYIAGQSTEVQNNVDVIRRLSKDFTVDSATARNLDKLLQESRELDEKLAAQANKPARPKARPATTKRLKATAAPVIPFPSADTATQNFGQAMQQLFDQLQRGQLRAGKISEEDLDEELRRKLQAQTSSVQYHIGKKAGPVVPAQSDVPVFQQIVDDVVLGQNVFLVGGAGTGKTTLSKAVARAVDRPYLTINCSQWTTPTEIIGGQTLDGYQEGKLIEAWRNGYMLVLDEMPKLDPNTAGLFNDALALSKEPKGRIFNSRMESFERHPNFACIATGNIYPNSESSTYGANNKQDLSLLDRFSGSVYWIEKNPDLEARVVGSQLLFSWLDALRTAVETLKYEAVLSMRFMTTCRDVLVLEINRARSRNNVPNGRTLADCFNSYLSAGFTPVQREAILKTFRSSTTLENIMSRGYREARVWKLLTDQLETSGMLAAGMAGTLGEIYVDFA